MNWKNTALLAVIPLAFLMGYLLQTFITDDDVAVPVEEVQPVPASEPQAIVREAYPESPSSNYEQEEFIDEDPLVAAPASLEGSDDSVRDAATDLSSGNSGQWLRTKSAYTGNRSGGCSAASRSHQLLSVAGMDASFSGR